MISTSSYVNAWANGYHLSLFKYCGADEKWGFAEKINVRGHRAKGTLK
jgi:hypothetical protein